ncbi:MAG: class I SAM-dependent methyltransferase [Alkalispirochaeta sp.]
MVTRTPFVPSDLVYRITNRLSRSWARGKLRHIAAFLLGGVPDGGSIIDIGSGKGMVARMLRERGFRVTSVDIRDRSLPGTPTPVLYDGRTIPFDDGEFDCALLLTVLHHTAEPSVVLREAARVARAVIVIEDVFSNPVQKHLTFFTDSLFNLEFRGHPHTNKTDSEWRHTFRELDLDVAGFEGRRVLLFYRQHAYHLKKGPR